MMKDLTEGKSKKRGKTDRDNSIFDGKHFNHHQHEPVDDVQNRNTHAVLLLNQIE